VIVADQVDFILEMNKLLEFALKVLELGVLRVESL